MRPVPRNALFNLEAMRKDFKFADARMVHFKFGGLISFLEDDQAGTACPLAQTKQESMPHTR
jgi:hypothetical protein